MVGFGIGLVLILCSIWILLRSGYLVEIHPPLDNHRPAEKASKPRNDLIDELEKHVKMLAENIGPRSYLTPLKLNEAADYVEKRFQEIHTSQPKSAKVESFNVEVREVISRGRDCYGRSRSDDLTNIEKPRETKVRNIELEIRGENKDAEVIVIGAHYDSDGFESGGCNPGADDNATGVAALIELAKMLKSKKLPRTLRFVAFTNEEEPFFATKWMGSYQYAKNRKGSVKAMLSLETMGYFTDKPKSQKFLDWRWFDKLLRVPDRGNFIAFVANWQSAPLMRHSLAWFRDSNKTFPSAGIVTFGFTPGVFWSDHWSYWQVGLPAIMVTDTAKRRNPCYHEPCDIPGIVDYEGLAHVVEGLANVVESLANPSKWP